MPGIGIIGGTGFKEWEGFDVKEKREEETPWGTPSSPLYVGDVEGEEVVLLLRHGEDRDIPPHQINYHANIYALQREVDEIVGVSSAGALYDEIKVPSISVPEDYVNFWNVPTFYNEEIKHVTPELSDELRDGLVTSADEVMKEKEVRREDVYIQTTGPRLETKAEVNVLKNFGDLVGMTMASEATLCKETNVKYASIVSIDNYAHGVGGEEVDYEEIVKTARENWEDVTELMGAFLKKR